MKYIIFLITLVTLISCKPETESGHGQDAQIAEVQSTPGAQEVLEQLKGLSPEQGVGVVKEAIQKNFDGGLTEKAADIISNVLYNFDDEKSIQVYAPAFLEMAKGKQGIENFYAGLEAAFLTKYPQGDYSQTIKDGSTISTLLTNKADLINNKNFNRFSVPDAKDYIELSEAYALISPRDEDAGAQLIKAGNTAKSIPGYAAKAVALYDWLLAKQPNHPKAGQALFLKAFTYDNELKKPDVAAQLYKEFIEKFPKDDFADDAQLLLENVGKTDQEFYETIVKKKEKK